MVVAVDERTLADTLPMSTVGLLAKPVPSMVTLAPPVVEPDFGLILVTVGSG